MKVDKAVCTTDTLDDLSRVIKFEAIFSSLVENKILAIKRECEEEPEQTNKLCGTNPSKTTKKSRRSIGNILFRKKFFGNSSVETTDVNELNEIVTLDPKFDISDKFVEKRNEKTVDQKETGLDTVINLKSTGIDEIVPDSLSIENVPSEVLTFQVNIDGEVESMGGATAISDQEQTISHESGCSGKRVRLTCNHNHHHHHHHHHHGSRSSKTNTGKDTSIHIENERTRLRILEAKSISAQCSPIFPRQKLGELPRSYVTSFDEAYASSHRDREVEYEREYRNPRCHEINNVDRIEPYNPVIPDQSDNSIITETKQSIIPPVKPTKKSSKTKTQTKNKNSNSYSDLTIQTARLEYDSIISFSQPNTSSSSQGFISSFNQITSNNFNISNSILPVITTTTKPAKKIKKLSKAVVSSTSSPNHCESIKLQRLNSNLNKETNDNKTQKEECLGEKMSTTSIGYDNAGSLVDSKKGDKKVNDSSAISKTTKKPFNKKQSVKDKCKDIDKINDKIQRNQDNVIDESDEEFKKWKRRYRRSQRYSDPVLVFPSSSGLQHCILSRPPNQPLQLQYDDDFIYDVSLQLEPDQDDLDELAPERRKHRHRHHKHGRKNRHKRRKVLVHDLDNRSVKVVKVIDPDDLPQRARWTIIATAFLLLIMCLLLVGVTLRMAPIIDDMDFTINSEAPTPLSNCLQNTKRNLSDNSDIEPASVTAQKRAASTLHFNPSSTSLSNNFPVTDTYTDIPSCNINTDDRNYLNPENIETSLSPTFPHGYADNASHSQNSKSNVSARPHQSDVRSDAMSQSLNSSPFLMASQSTIQSHDISHSMAHQPISSKRTRDTPLQHSETENTKLSPTKEIKINGNILSYATKDNIIPAGPKKIIQINDWNISNEATITMAKEVSPGVLIANTLFKSVIQSIQKTPTGPTQDIEKSPTDKTRSKTPDNDPDESRVISGISSIPILYSEVLKQNISQDSKHLPKKISKTTQTSSIPTKLKNTKNYTHHKLQTTTTLKFQTNSNRNESRFQKHKS